MQELQPLISVIVPVYKVEKYLEACIVSITNQTYQNLEIFLVDDGSPDNCGAICNKAAELDDRIVVIHQKNQGQSVARNVALDRAKGEYLAFVDSDDALANDMLEYLYEGILRTDSDIALCGFQKIMQNKTMNENSFDSETIFIGRDVLEMMIVDEKIGSQPCNKLYRAELFENLRFPQGRIFEDIALMHHVFARAKQIVCLPECKYLYTIHEGSTSYSVGAKWEYDLFKAFADRYEFAVTQEISSKIKNIVLSKACAQALTGAIVWNPQNENEKFYLSEVAAFVKNNFDAIIKNRNIPLKNTIRLWIIKYGMLFFKKIYKGTH